jgi:ubiquinone/menaquinone biosynthesis C-methylase UbiE
LSVDPRWYESFFDSDEWLLLATSVDAERIEREVAFLAEQLPAGGHVLDLACGTGRIAVPLAARGFAVAGIDISQRALEVARRAGPELDLRHGDMRELPWADGSFDAVINLWTAFGYFETPEEDERVLREVARVLRPGGVFLIDTVNATSLHRSFRPESWRELEDGTFMLERRVVDLPTGRIRAYWTFLKDGARTELSFDHRLYGAAEYGELFRRAGLEPVRWFGGFDGSELGVDSWRLIAVAGRP